MSKVIVKGRFFEHKKDSRGKPKINGLVDYFNRDEAVDKTTLNRDVDGLSDYMAFRQGSTGLFNSRGDVTNLEVKKKLQNNAKQKGIVWDYIISLESIDYAKSKGMKNKIDYQLMLTKVLPKWFQELGFDPKNMEWVGAYHTNTEQPHVHLMFFEKQVFRSKGKLSKEIHKNSLQREVYKHLEKDRYDSIFQQESQAKDNIKKNIDVSKLTQDNVSLDILFDKLLKKIPRTGKMQYSSKNIAPYKKDIDVFVKSLLKDDVVNLYYDEWKETLNKLIKLQKEIGINNQRVSKQIRIKTQRLHTDVANMVLKAIKEQREFDKNSNPALLDVKDLFREQHLKLGFEGFVEMKKALYRKPSLRDVISENKDLWIKNVEDNASEHKKNEINEEIAKFILSNKRFRNNFIKEISNNFRNRNARSGRLYTGQDHRAISQKMREFDKQIDKFFKRLERQIEEENFKKGIDI